MSNAEHYTPTDRIGQLLFTLGNAYLDRQQYPEAFEKFEQLIDRNIDSADVWHKAAISAIGANSTSEKAMTIYKKALECNPESSALKIGIATLFAQVELINPFTTELCESALAFKPANAQKIHLFLKKAYEESGQKEKVYEHEQKVIFGSNNKKAIRSYLESLWWEQKFEEANRAIATATDPVNPEMQFQVERALTLAYELLHKNQFADNKLERSMLESGLEQVKPENSLQALRAFITLKSCQQDEEKIAKKFDDELLEEYQFILGNISLSDALLTSNGKNHTAESKTSFNFSKDILDALPKIQAQCEVYEENRTQAICFMQLFTHGNTGISEKLVKLVEDHIVQSELCMSLRRAGAGFIILSERFPELVLAVTKLLHYIDEYNQKISKQYRISLLCGIWLTDFPRITSDRDRLNEFLHASHLLRIVERNATKDTEAGMLLIASQEGTLNTSDEKLSELSLLQKGPIEILPGTHLPYFEVMWKSALESIKEGQGYNLGRFEIKKCLMKHKAYATYSAFDEQLSRTVLIKILLVKESIRYLQDSNARQDLIEQIRAIGRLNHPHIANLYDMGEHKNMFYYVREYIEGKNISDIEFTPENKEAKVLELAQKIIRALAYAQHKNVLHLNLKPGNIWINGAQEISITDFRITGFSENLNTDGTVLYPGYWRYLAPELFEKAQFDMRSDFYSLGIIIYELLAGRHPYDQTAKIQQPEDIKNIKIPPLTEHGGDLVSPIWQQLINRTIVWDPDQRFNSYSQIDLELRKIQMNLMAAQVA
ncbi:MAG: protein kinase [Deferribacteres bacterium]|nr:protein kinase [Deferribacteres bacterium]